MTAAHVHQAAVMGTVLSIQILGDDDGRRARQDRQAGIDQVVAWFNRVEADCSRFDPASELRRLCMVRGRPVQVSALLFRAVEFAVAVARETDGAFDPAVGAAMEQLGFDAHHRSGNRDRSGITAEAAASFRDIELDAETRSITLHLPMLLDLGAVAKGLAVDLGAQELRRFENFAIDAGGDLYLGGRNGDGDPWSVGIRNPRNPDDSIETVRVTDRAVCTSGDYERRAADGVSHHLVDPRSGVSATAVASVTTIAPSAMVADALATAAFVLGPDAGLALLAANDVEGLFVGPDATIRRTDGWPAGAQ